jgi:DNA-binding beta-propeller fold protein YncE
MIAFVRKYTAVSMFTVALAASAASGAHAQIAVSANDGKVKLENGTVRIVKDGVDTVSLVDLGANPPKMVAEIKVPASVAGPPTSVAVSPNEEIALVTAAMKIDPADPTKQIPDDVLTVLDISRNGGFVKNVAARVQGKQASTGYEPKVLATLQVGKGAAGVSFNKAGTLALVANRSEGTVSVLEIKGKTVRVLPDKISLGNDKSGPSAVSFTPDGKTALVTRDGDHKISVLAIDGTKVTDTKREMTAGMRPYGLDIAPKGDIAVVANIGTGSGDADTLSVIDLTAKPPRVVETVSVGQTPEGVKISPDGRYVAVSVMNGTNKASDNPFFNGKGKVVVLRINGRDLTHVVEADVGRWCQGIVWSSNSRKLIVQCMVEQQLMAFSFDGRKLQSTGTVNTTGGPAGIRTAEK